MNFEKACAEAERLSLKHKDTEFAVIIGSIHQRGEKYQITTRAELAHWKTLYVPVKSYLNGKGEDFR